MTYLGIRDTVDSMGIILQLKSLVGSEAKRQDVLALYTALQDRQRLVSDANALLLYPTGRCFAWQDPTRVCFNAAN